ncbi:MAG: hypothetical protein GKS00_00405 [Alphaproteobacteria bacterium]|nr:hypothetical protein [Alphaproteobacteria bacterium]
MRRKCLFVVLKAGVSAALLAWLWSRFDLSAAFARIPDLEIAPVAAAFLVLLLHGVLSAWRWRTIIRLQDGKLPWGDALRLFFIAMFFNQTLSTTVGGDAARVWMLRADGTKLGTATAGIVLERIAGFLALTPLILTGLMLLPGAGQSALLALLAVSVGLALVILIGERFAKIRWRWLAWVGDAAQTARRILLSAEGLLVLSQSLLIHLGAGAAVYLLALAANASPGLLVCLALTPPVLLLATFPITFGGWGLREAALMWLFAFFGIATAPALTVSVTLGILVMAAGLPGAVLWIIRGRTARALSTPPRQTTSPHRPDAAPRAAAAPPSAGSPRQE